MTGIVQYTINVFMSNNSGLAWSEGKKKNLLSFPELYKVHSICM